MRSVLVSIVFLSSAALSCWWINMTGDGPARVARAIAEVIVSPGRQRR